MAYLLAVIVAMLTAQVLIHRQHAGLTALAPLRLAGRMVLLAIPVMLILFVLFPRIPGPLWGLPKDAYKGRTGLSDQMDAGDDQRIEPVRRSGVPGPLHQRHSAAQPALLARAGAVAFRWPALEPARGIADPDSDAFYAGRPGGGLCGRSWSRATGAGCSRWICPPACRRAPG